MVDKAIAFCFAPTVIYRGTFTWSGTNTKIRRCGISNSIQSKFFFFFFFKQRCTVAGDQDLLSFWGMTPAAEAVNNLICAQCLNKRRPWLLSAIVVAISLVSSILYLSGHFKNCLYVGAAIRGYLNLWSNRHFCLQRAAKHHINISLFSSKEELEEKEIVWTDGAPQHTSHQAVFQWINRNQISRWIALHRFCAGLPLGRERKGIGGWRGKEGTRRRDYRRHCSLCERLSLARQGGGTLWILMNWQDSPQPQLRFRAMRTTWGRRRRWLGRYSLSMAKQTEQVIFPVIIIAITRHEGLEMDLLILHAPQKRPQCLSKRKAWWCEGVGEGGGCCRWGDCGKSRSVCLKRAAGELGLWGRS